MSDFTITDTKIYCVVGLGCDYLKDLDVEGIKNGYRQLVIFQRQIVKLFVIKVHQLLNV